MPVPVEIKETKKPRVQAEKATETAKQVNVRPRVADLIEKVVQENAPTWKELAKR